MKSTMHLLAKLGVLSLLAILPVGSAFAQTDVTKTVTDVTKVIQDRLNAEGAKLEASCGDDIKKYCSDVTPGEGRILYCMHAHEDKISPKCLLDLEETAADVQLASDNLRDAMLACKAEITGVCGSTPPGQGRLVACLLTNKSTASPACGDVLGRIQAFAAH
jgi:hypothetical protein